MPTRALRERLLAKEKVARAQANELSESDSSTHRGSSHIFNPFAEFSDFWAQFRNLIRFKIKRVDLWLRSRSNTLSKDNPIQISLSKQSYFSNSVAISHQNVSAYGDEYHYSSIYEGSQAKQALIMLENSTSTFKFLSFTSHNVRTLTVISQSKVTLSHSSLDLFAIRSPFECVESTLLISDSSLIVNSGDRFVAPLTDEQSRDGNVFVIRCDFNDFTTAAELPLFVKNGFGLLSIDGCRFTNVSTLNTAPHDQTPLPSNTTIANSEFTGCRNVLYGCVTPDMNSGSSHLVVNSTFSHSRTTYTGNDTMKHVQASTSEMKHSFKNCKWTSCTTNYCGGAIDASRGGDLTVSQCIFTACSSLNSSDTFPQGRGGAICHDGLQKRAVTISHCLFTGNIANSAAAFASYNASRLIVEYTNSSYHTTVPYEIGANGTTGTFHFMWTNGESYVQNSRFEHNVAAGACAGIDNCNITVSMHYSQVFFFNNTAAQAGAVLYSLVVTDPIISWFSCAFRDNKVTESWPNAIGGVSTLCGSDIWFSEDTAYWNTTLKSDHSFVNCFSTSPQQRVVINMGSKGTHCVDKFANGTSLSIHLPDPRIMIAKTGKDSSKCGTSYSTYCQSLGYVGNNRIPFIGGEIVIRSGEYEEAAPFTFEDVEMMITGFDDEISFLILKHDLTPFIVAESGELFLRYLKIQTSPLAPTLRQQGTGTLKIDSVSFVATSSAEVTSHQIQLNEGSMHMTNTSFSGFGIKNSGLVHAEDFKSLTLKDCSFTEMISTNGTIILVSDTELGSDLSIEKCVFAGKMGEEQTPAALSASGVATLTIKDCSFSSLRNKHAKAAVSLFQSVAHFKLNDLIFEQCIGAEASDLFIEFESAGSVDTVDGCLSSSRKLNGLINGRDLNELTRPTHTLQVHAGNGEDKLFCWRSGEQCQTLTGLVERLGEDIAGSVQVAAGTSMERGLEVVGSQDLGVTGSSTILKRGDESVPLVEVKSGTLSLTSFILTLGSSAGSSSLIKTNGTIELKSVTLLKGTTSTFNNPLIQALSGSISLSSVTVPNELTFSTCSLISIGSSSLSISGTTFNQIKSTNPGSVISGSLEADNTISITSSTFKSCSSDSDGGVMTLFMAQDSPSTSLVIQATFESCSCGEGKKGAWIYLFGLNLGSLIQKACWTGTYEKLKLGKDDNVMWGEDIAMTETPYASITLLMYLVTYTGDVIFAGSEGRDFDACGMETFPCQTITVGQAHCEGSKVSLIVLEEAKMECEVATSKFGEMELKGHVTEQTKVVVSGNSFFSTKTATNAETVLKITDLDFDLTAAASKTFFVSENQHLTITRSSFVLFSTMTTPFIRSVNGKLVLNNVTASSTTLSSSPLILSTSSVEVSDCVFSSINRTSGLGAILSIELSETVSTKMINTKFTNCKSEESLCSVLLTGTNEGTFKKESWTGTFDHPLPRSTVLQQTPNWTYDTIYNPYSLLYSWYRPSDGIVFSSSAAEDDLDHPFCGHTFLPCRSVDKALGDDADVVVVRTKSVLNKEWVLQKDQIEIKAEETITEEGVSQPNVIVEIGESASIVVKPQNTNSAQRVCLSALTLTIVNSLRKSTKPIISLQTGGTLVLDTVLLSSLTLTAASVVKMEGASALSVSGSEFKSISQTGSGGGAFLSTNGDSDQIVSITDSSFESVSSVGDGGVILAQLGTGSKLTVASTTFKLCSSSVKGGSLSIVLTSTGSFALEAETSFQSCSATGSGTAVFVEAPSLVAAITKTSMAFLAPFPLTPTAALLGMHRGWSTANKSDSVPLVLFFAEVGSTGFASSSGSDGEPCGFSVYPCSTINRVQTRLEANGSKTEGKLNPITLELQTALDQSTAFSCGGHTATITGNTVTLSETGHFTTSSSESVLTLSSLTILFATSLAQPAISVSTGSVVVSGCTVGNGAADIPVSFGSVSGGSLKLNGTNTMKLLSTSSSLFIITSGTLEIESGTSLTHSTTKRTSSLFVLSGGSTTITSLAVPSLTLDSASSVFSVTKIASLSLSSIAFASISNEGSGSVIHSTSTGQIELDTVSFTSCNCGVNGKGRSVFITRELFSSGDVVMEDVSIPTVGTTGIHEVYLEGGNVGAVVTTDWASLIGLNNETLTKAKLEEVFGSDSKNMTNIGPLGYHLYPHTSGAVFVSEGFWDHGKCGQERLPCSSLDLAFSLLTDTKTTLSLSSDLTLSTSLSSPSTGASISSSSSPQSLIFGSNGQFAVEDGSLSFSSIGITIPSSLTQPLFIVKGSTLTLSNSVTITNPSSATHSSSLFKIEGGELHLSGTVFNFTVRFSSSSALLTQTGGQIELSTVLLSSLTLTSASVINMKGASALSVSGSEFKSISQTGSGGGAFLSTNGDSDQIVSITDSSFESVSSVGDGGVILARLGTGSKLTVTDTTFKLCSSSGKGGALSIVLTSTGSFTLQTGTSFESCSATVSGSALFVEAPSLASAITEASMAFLAPFPLTPSYLLLTLHRGWNTANTSDVVPLALFLAEVGSTGYVSASGSFDELCGFSLHPCSSLNTIQARLAANGSKTEGKLNPITIVLQTGFDQSTLFSCGGHTATITGNTIKLSKTGQFTTSSTDSVLTLSSLTILFAYTQTQPAISVSLGKIVVSVCTIGKGAADIPVSFGSVSGGELEMSGTNTMKLVSTSSPLFVVSSGILKIGSGTTLTHSATKRTSSLFVLSGGSTTITSLTVPSLTLDSSSNVFSLTKTASLSLSSISFNSISNEGSGSVIHSTSTGTLSLLSVSFSSCNCGSSGKGRSVFISRPLFSSGGVVMKSVSIGTAGTTGNHEVYLQGENVGAVVNSDWKSLIGLNNETLTKAKLEEVFGSDSTNTTNIGPLGYHLYPHTSGAVFVSERFWDHGKCGQERLPCSTLDFALSLLTDSKTTLALISDETLSTPLSSPSTGITLPSSLTRPLFVVRGSTLTLSSTVTITNPPSAAHTASLFKIEGGTLDLIGTVFDFTIPFSSSSALLIQTGGTVKLNTVTIGNVSCTVGDGSIVHSSLSSSDKLEIVGCSFSSCSSSGNGGALFVSSSLDHNPANLIIQSTFGTDISCGEGKKGKWVFLRGNSLESYLKDSTWTGSISALVAPTHDALLWGEDGSEKEGSEYASLSLLYYLKAYNQPTIAVGDGGRDGVGCGRTHLRCSSLSTAVSHLSGSDPLEVEIVSSLTLVKKEPFSLSLTMKPSKETATIAVGESGAFEVSANALTLSTLTFDGKRTERSTSLLSIVNTGSITIAGCTFKDLKTSGKGSVFSSALNTGNTLSISESSFSSCSSAGNGGALFVEVNGGSFEIPATLAFTDCSSEGKGQNLFLVNSNLQLLLSGWNLDGIKPTLPSTGLVSKDEKAKWFGSTSSTGESSSLLFFWHPHTESSAAVHVHENGESHSLCGLHQLPCSLIQPSLSKTTTDNKTIIDSNFALNESITTANTPSTLTSASKNVTVSVGVSGNFALSSGSLTLSALSFVQSSSVELLEHALIVVDSATSSLIVDGCSFSSFRLSLNALIEHSHSSLTLKSSKFTDIVRLEGDGGVVESVMEEGMVLDVNSVELASVWTLSGDGDGFFISFNSISDPSKIPSFNLKNLKYSESAGSERNTERKASFVWMEGHKLSEWVSLSDARFAGSYSPIGMESEWLWSVDWEEGLNASLLFYLVAHTGAIGVSSEGYPIVQCGYSGVWCRGLEYGMAVADSKGEKQLNIHDTVEITNVIDLNAEYRVHGKVGSSVLSVVGSGGLVVDSGEHVEIDGVSVVVGVDCSSEVLSCVSSVLVLDSIVFSCGGDPSSLINTTLMSVDGDGSVGRFSSLSLLNGVSLDGKLLLVKKGTVQMTDVFVSSSIGLSGGLVSVSGGSFSLVNLALPPLSFSSTPFVLSSFAACSFTNLTAKQLQTQTLLTAEHGEDLTFTSCTFDGISTSQNDDKDDENDQLCTWSTGLITINETPTTIRSSFFSHLSQGAIAVNGSILSLFNTKMSSNGMSHPTFASARRNIRCLSGEVRIEDESSTNEESESLWISTDDCVVKKGSGVAVSALFVPKLDVGKTKSVSNKNHSLSIDLVGSMLIPCNLFLLISEVREKSSNSEKLRIELKPSKFEWKNESSISVSLSLSELDKLDRTFGWNGTLVFGDGSTTDWFVVKASQADELNAHMKKVLKWMIPLIVGCVVALLLIVVIIVILHRHSSKAKAKESLLKQEQDEMNDLPPDKVEFEDGLLHPHSTSLVTDVSDAPFEKANQSEHNQLQQTFNPYHASSKEVSINRKDTLYNRLHSADRAPIGKFLTAQQIVQALSRLHKTNMHIALFSRFSSHFVMFDKDGNVTLDVASTTSTPQSQQHVSVPQSLIHPVPSTQQSVASEAEKQGEGFELLRWRAPEATAETGEPTKEFDARRAVVFSLGLVLFEIETGLVPHGEMDAMNASRQLKAGVLPKMELVKDSQLKDLIVECLSVEPEKRPNLDDLEERLLSVQFSLSSAVLFNAMQ
ncbi:hypothetical protein BLNAU_22184 [Blattamonas nauphoetae]|uniref:Protein kinase domain-containing protein n=1 Tax=Blattamonas nauphoetae TaxID=2049346 RepID=A0ABQ9WU94_9EUKA|nr:hypothetical protein BLNAU_22184 [Blattamonas nauphoetae]